jgi:uncharacterized protein YndB with AHSA1/START domain
MWEVTEQIVLAAPPERVWAVVTDVAGHAELAGSGEIRALRLAGPVSLGRTWEADIAVPGLEEPFVARSEVVVFDEASEFSWTSVPRPIIPGEPRSVPGVRWWFRLAPAEQGRTAVEHRVLVTPPEVGAQEMAEFFEETNRVGSIRAGMRVTLERLKASAERSG